MRAPVILATAGLLVVVSPASAAKLRAGKRCYQETQDVVVRGGGFAAGSTVMVSRRGVAIGSAQADAAGNFAARLPSQELPRGRREALYNIAATDGVTTAVARYRISKVFADFSPGRGDLSTLRVRFSVNGFGLLERRSPVYVHYVNPSGGARRTVRLGTAAGTCGLIRRTSRRQLFPFSAERGRWVLQFDTRRRYRRANQRSSFIWVRKPVQVFNRT